MLTLANALVALVLAKKFPYNDIEASLRRTITVNVAPGMKAKPMSGNVYGVPQSRQLRAVVTHANFTGPCHAQVVQNKVESGGQPMLLACNR